MTVHGALRQPRSARPAPATTHRAARPGRGRALRLTGVVGVLLLVVLFGLVGFHALIVANQGTMDQLDRDIDAARRRHQALDLEVAQLESPERIRAEAIGRLGMVEPDTVTYLEPIVTTMAGDEPQPEADRARGGDRGDAAR